jgi:RHS repeat-associated protein
VPSIGFAASYGLPGSVGLDDMRARDYSPSSSDFASVDPLLATTAQPYAYASDTPEFLNDPDGLIGGGDCLSGLAAFGLALFDSSCVMVTLNLSTGTFQFGLTRTAGIGEGWPSLGFLAGPEFTNANYISELGGPFGQVGGSAELGGATVGGDFAIGNGPCNGLIWTGSGGAGLSYDLSPFVFAGGEVHGGVTDTLTNTVASFNLYDLWDKITSFLP